MLRRFLILLFCWPLLMPPGFCICRLEAFLPRPAERPAAARRQDQAAKPAPKCHCCRPTESTPHGETAANQADIAPSTSSPNDHPPGCPASPQWKAARASMHVADGFDLADLLLDASAACRVHRSPAGPVPVRVATFPPLAAPSLYSCNFRC